jgi:hypothetical protein
MKARINYAAAARQEYVGALRRRVHELHARAGGVPVKDTRQDRKSRTVDIGSLIISSAQEGMGGLMGNADMDLVDACERLGKMRDVAREKILADVQSFIDDVLRDGSIQETLAKAIVTQSAKKCGSEFLPQIEDAVRKKIEELWPAHVENAALDVVREESEKLRARIVRR